MIYNNKFIEDLTDMISKMFGSQCEVLFHDWSGGHDHSIKFIKNGQVTGRAVGDPVNNIILEVINTGKFENRFNSVTHTKDGRTLKSSTVYLMDQTGKAVGAFCINWDVTELVSQMRILGEFVSRDVSTATTVDSFHANDVNDLLDYLIAEAMRKIGKEPTEFSKEDRIGFVEYLDNKGAFLITKSSNKICETLGVSKYTLYTDLAEIKAKKDARRQEGNDGSCCG